jgi:hypothetical protein
MRLFALAAALGLLMCTASAQQHLGEKRITASGNVVTVYSIAWPTPVSPVNADVEVCASANAPPYTFAFPSYFQLRFADGGIIAPYGSRKKPTLENAAPVQTVRAGLARLCRDLRTKAGRHSLSRSGSG